MASRMETLRSSAFALLLLYCSTLLCSVMATHTDPPTVVTLSFSRSVYEVEENTATGADVCVGSDIALTEAVLVELSTLERSNFSFATEFEDFIPELRNVTLPAGESPATVCITIAILDDGLALEGDEAVAVRFEVLSNPPDRVVFATRYQEATVVILDDDVVMVALSAGTYLTREEAGSREVCLTLDGPIATPLYVNMSADETTPINATAFLDFTSEVKVITFPPSENSVSFACTSFEILEDKIAFEGSESFVVSIGAIEAIDVSNVAIGLFSSVVVIQDNDDVTLTYEIQERPDAIRPIPGESIVFTCEVDGLALIWTSEAFIPPNTITFFEALDSVGDEKTDPITGAVAVLLNSTSEGHLISQLSFPNSSASLLNNTALICSDVDGRFNNESFYLAGITSPPIAPQQTNNTCHCVNVTWEPPEFNGAAEILYYTVSLYPETNDSLLTQIDTTDAEMTTLEICDLAPNLLYNASVVAVNDVGDSDTAPFNINIIAREPLPPVSVMVEQSCRDPSLCFSGSVDVTWDDPDANTALTCSVDAIVVNYTTIELEVEIGNTSVTLLPDEAVFAITPVAPGRSYIVSVSFINEVGESLDNAVVREDVLLFRSVRFQKLSSPGTIPEGESAFYSVTLNGPPPEDIAVSLYNQDSHTSVSSFLSFNSSNWFADQNVVILAVDDDFILESPYGAVVSLNSLSNRASYEKNTTVTLVLSDTDRAEVLIVPKEAYPYPPDIPEGRWAVYEVTLPNQPQATVVITFRTISDTIALSPSEMIFETQFWDVPQDLTVFSHDDGEDMGVVFDAAFNLSLSSADTNYNQQPLPDFVVTVEDNDEGEAILSGSLSWKAVSEYGRTAAQFTLTLTLLHTSTPNASVGRVINLPGQLRFGDGTFATPEEVQLTVVVINEEFGYLVAEGSVVHVYPSANLYGNPWWVGLHYCCRGKSLINNRGTTLVLSVGVDLTYDASPTLPTLPPITLTPSQGSLQHFFYTPLHPQLHTLTHSLGDVADYHSSHAGSPQGMEVSYSSGHVTWDTAHVTPGEYSVQIVTEDVFTGIRAAAEVRISVIQPHSGSPPVILTTHPLLPPDTLYVALGNELSYNISVWDGDGILGASLVPILPLPEGVWLDELLITGGNSALVRFHWQPTESQLGEHILCFVAYDGYLTPSPPLCLTVVVEDTLTELVVLDLNGFENGPVFEQTFIKGLNQSVPIASPDSTLSLAPSSTIEHMSIEIVQYRDGVFERLTIEDDFSHPSLSYEVASTELDVPGVLVVQGRANGDAYLQAIRSVSYANDRDRPTVGDRLVIVTLYDGESTNQITESYTMISVVIENFPPRLSLSGNEESFSNRYLPSKGPIAAVNPQNAYIIDTDSGAIEQATLQLFNVEDALNEILTVTYRSSESVNLPIIAEARNVELVFGTLWRDEEVPVITSTIFIGETGYVGDVDVIVDIRHSWVGDLKIELEHGGRKELLVLSPGGQVCRRDNLFRTTFDSDSSSNVFLSKTVVSPGVCQFQSQGLFTPDGDLTTFRGDVIEGEWRLIVTDLLLENDSGRLVSWSVVIQPIAENLVVSYPPVVPILVVGGEGESFEERHEREVESDGRITDISVHIHLGIPFTAIQLYLPSISLIHPDGTEILLADGSIPLCAVGNFSYLVFNDRSPGQDYSCEGLLANQQSGSGSGSSSDSGLRPLDVNDTTDGGENDASISGFGQSGSGSGSTSGSGIGGSGIGMQVDGVDYDDIIDLNISVPVKHTLADLLTPVDRLSNLRGKLAGGKWTLLVSSQNQLESTLLGWSLRVAREPNIDPAYNAQTNTLTLSGADSVANYQTVLRSVVYNNLSPSPDFSVVRYIESSVYDGELYSNVSLPSSLSFITVHHIDIDLDPLDSTPAPAPDYTVSFQEHGDPIPILDPENAILRDEGFASGEYLLTVTLNGFQNGNEEGIFVNTSVAPNLQAAFSNDSDNQQLILMISSAIVGEYQTIESFEAVMRTLEYFNFAEEFLGESRVIEIQAIDFQMDSNFISYTARSTITFIATNDIPVLLLNSYQFDETDQFSNILDYVEGQGPLELTNASAIILTDNDHDYLQYVSIAIQNPQDGDNELLGAITSGTNITAEFNISDHSLLLSGMATLEDYITVLGTVTYINNVHSPGMPGTEPRQITFVPFDGAHEGNSAIALVTFAAVNDPAMANLNRFATYVEENGPVLIISENSTLFDVDDVTLAYIDVQITNPFDGENEVLSVMNIIEHTDPELKIVTVTNLRPDTMYDPGTGTLRISGLDSIREYQEVLKTLTYDNLADEPNPGMRIVSVVLNDSHTSSNPVFIEVDIVLVNDSPFFRFSIPSIQLEILEDTPEATNFGISIPEISFLFSDDDVNASLGIAIVELNPGNGTAQFSLNNGMDWSPIDTTVSLSYALALESINENRIRYVPDPNFNGVADFTIVVWDTTDGSQSGQYINATSTSNIDAFSSDSLTITVLIIAVNDAPVLLDIPLQLTSIDEDSVNSAGDTIASLLTYASDVDIAILPPGELGIAVVSAEQDYGVWQFTSDGGNSWDDFEEVNDTSALLLRSEPEELNRVRFVPNQDFNGDVSFRFLVWDLTRLPEDDVIDVSGSGMEFGSVGSGIMGSGSIEIGSGDSSASGFSLFASGDPIPEPETDTPEPNIPPYPSGTRNINTTLSDPTTGPFSVNSTYTTLTVEPINDSPVIEPGMALQSITEGSAISINHGTMVADIITRFYSDVDVNPDMGLAVVGVNDRFGQWEYTCESPALGNWQVFIGGMYYGQVIPRLPLPEMATLLLSSCWIRFVPVAYFNTELDFQGYPRPVSDLPYIRVYGWDNTGLTSGQSGIFGNDATYAADSNTNEYSSNAELVTIQVISVNDVPILYLSDSTTVNYQNTYYEDGLPVRAVGEELTLIDNDHARLVDVTVTIYGSQFDVSPFNEVDFGSSFSGDFFEDDVASSSSGSGSGISGIGGVFSGIGSGIGNEFIFVPGISSAPSLPPLHRIAEYVRDNLTNPTFLQSYCAGLEERQERLLITTGNLDLDYEILSWCPFTLRVFANPSIAFDAPKEQFELALRTLHYNNSIEEPGPGTRTLTFIVSDNFGLSAPSNSSIDVQLVNDFPVLDLNIHIPDVNNYVSYTEGQGPLMLTNASLLRLIDNDNSYLQYARVVLFEAPDLDDEVLNATTDGTNIAAMYENFTLTLSGNDTITNYAAVLASVMYTNTYANPGNPDERERQVEFYVSDGSIESYVAITFISFTGINNRPRLDVNGDAQGVNYTTEFVEEQGPVVIVDSNVIVRDEDNITLAYITARILEVFDFGMEYLEVDSRMLSQVLEQNMNDQDKIVQITNLIPNMTYDVVTGMLTISGLDTLDEYRLVLQTLTYNNLADEPIPDCRLIEFIASDSELDSNPVYTEVCIGFENDSPRFNTSIPGVYSPLILEDEFDEIGIEVFSFAYELIEDDDRPSTMRGIAIVSVESDNGEWEYRVNGSAQWNVIRPNTNFTTSILLSAELGAGDYIRFVPNQDFNGNASITFVAWDGSSGMQSGGMRSAISQNSLDPFSDDTRSMVLRIVPVNDAPTLDTSIEPEMANILEDDVIERESFGEDISLFLDALIGDVDVLDIMAHEFGIAVIEVDDSNGYWQFTTDGGLNWTNISSPSSNNAVVLGTRPEDQNRIRFAPNADFNGVSTFQYKIWDRNVTFPSENGIDTNTDPVTGTFSVDSTTAHITIEPVNDSPVLIGPSSPLTPIQEDINPAINPGTFVSEILGDIFSDEDSSTEEGVAVVYVDRRYGDWQYTCDQGSAVIWRSFIGEQLLFDSIFGQISQVAPLGPNEFRATLLSSTCRIRYIPNFNFNTEYNLDGSPRNPADIPFVTFRGWDGTSGENMQEGVDTTSVPDDHTNAFSLAFVNATIFVFHVNDRPVLNLNGNFPNYLTSFVEPIPPERLVTPVSISNQPSLTDSDNASLAFVTVSFQRLDGDSEELIVRTSGTSLMANATIIMESGVETYLLIIDPQTGNSAPIEEFEAVLRTIEYLNSAEEPDATQSRIIQFVASDGLSIPFPIPFTELFVQLINDPPQLDIGNSWPDSYRFVSYGEGQGALLLVGAMTTLVDYDHDILDFARVFIRSPPDMQYEMLAANASETNVSIIPSADSSELLLQGPASVEDFLAVILTVTYENTRTNPSTMLRTIEFIVNDGLNDSIPVFVYLSFGAVNNPPFLDVNGFQPGVNHTVTFYEERGPINIVSPNTTVEDIDNVTLAFIEVTITNPLDGEREVLYVEDVTETSAPLDSRHVTFWNYRPQQLYDNETATLRIFGLELVYEYQEVLKTLQYDNFADEPNLETRLVHFVVSDGILNVTGVYSMIEMFGVNDSPSFNQSAPRFTPEINEDIPDLLNPGWSVEDIIDDIILDDDSNSMQGIAIIALESENGYWEVTWDYSTEFPFQSGGSGDFIGSASGSGSGQNGNETEVTAPTSSGLMPLASGSSDGMELIMDSDSNTDDDIFSGMQSASGSSDSGSSSGLFGSGMGSAIFGSGTDVPIPTTPPPPKCRMTTTPTQPPIIPNFYATWYRLPSNTSITMATVLKSEGPTTRIRFIPNENFNGAVSFQFLAWDQTDGLENGAVTDASSDSNTDAYSADSAEIIVTVNPINDAPRLANMTFDLTSILEDDTNSFGDDVASLLLGVTDIDMSDSEFGIAVVLADEENGEWQFSTEGGFDWTTMSDVCPYNATVLSSQPFGANRIRFVPFRNFNGFASFSFIAWDLTSGEDSGTLGIDTTISDPITGAFSSSYTTATVYVESVNDSPVITQGASLIPILEDTPENENVGMLVSDIVQGLHFDVDDSAQIGIAVVGVDLRFGTWEWRCQESEPWNVFIGDFLYGIIVPPNPLPEKATLLNATCRVRFLPNEDFNTLLDTDGVPRPLTDLPFISYVGWDNTGVSEGRSGQYGVDTSYNMDSDTNEFSAQTLEAVIEIISVNDFPELRITSEGDGMNFSVQYTEEQSYVRIVEPETLTLTDSDHARLDSITVILSNSEDPYTEILSLEIPSTVTNVVFDPNTGVAMVALDEYNTTEYVQIIINIFTDDVTSDQSSLTLTASPGRPRARVEAYETLLSFITYRNLNPEPSNSTRNIRFFIDDTEDINDFVSAEVEILLLNDNAPVLRNFLTFLDFVEEADTVISIVSDNLTLTDADHNEYFFITNATISLYPVPVSSEENVSVDLSVVPVEFNVSQSYDPSTAVLIIEGSAPVSVYEAILRTAVYENTIEEPLSGVRTISLQVYDGDNPGNYQRVQVDVILVNDQAPVMTTFSLPFVFTEWTNPVAIGDGLTVSDADSGDFPIINITFTITNNLDGQYELLRITTSGTVSSQFANGTLTLFGPASATEFQQTFSSLTYYNTAEEPSLAVREIAVLANDGDFSSREEFILIAIELVNDIPVINIPVRETIVNYVEGSGPVFITSNVTLVDNDHENLTLVTAIIVNPLDMPNEILAVNFTALEAVASGMGSGLLELESQDFTTTNISSSYDPETGLLTLSGNASIEAYQRLLQSLTYENIEANPGFPDTDPRMIEFLTFDGQNYSLPVVLTLTFESVNDPPMFDLNGFADGTNFSTSFTEEGGPVFITDPNIVVFDIDNTSLAYIRIAIENLQDGESEILSIAGNITDQLDLAFISYENGVLLIEGLGLSDVFEEVLSAVTYQNLADEPNFETRSISFVASDGLIESRVFYTTVEILPVNDPPRLTISGGLGILPPPVTLPPTEVPTDDGMGSGVSGSGISGSGIPGSGTSGFGILGSGSSGMRDTSGSGSAQAFDGMSGSGSGSALEPDPSMGMDQNDTEANETMTTVTPATQPPDTADILGNITVESDSNFTVLYAENAIPVAIVNGVLVEDDDNAFLTRLEVVLDGEQDQGYETIFFDSLLLSNELVARLFLAAPSMNGYLGDGSVCDTTNTMAYTRIDLNISLIISDWEAVIRSLKYCNSDNHPVGGERVITFRIQDPELAWSETQTTSVFVFAINDPPICTTTFNLFPIPEDSNITIPVLQNCMDFEDDLTGLSIVIATPPEIGQVFVDNTTGDITYIGFRDDYGTRTLEYQACDSLGVCSSPQLITIMINPINDPPFPTDDLTLVVLEDTPIVVPLTVYFGDVEDDLIPDNPYPRVVSVSRSTSGDWELIPGDVNSSLEYRPFQDFTGQDQLELTVCDSTNECVLITITVIVQSVNDIPEIDVLYEGGFPPAVTNEDTPLRIEILVIDVEDRAVLNVSVLEVANGEAIPDYSDLITLLEPVTDRWLQYLHILYTPNENYFGDDFITISAVDSEGASIEATINVSVSYVNDPPQFGLTRVTILEDENGVWRLPMDLFITDPEEVLNAGSFSIVQPASLGEVSYSFDESFFNTTGTFPAYGVLTYTPPEHFFTAENQTVTFAIRACDNDSITAPLCSESTIYVTVLSDNDAPHLPRLQLQTYEESATTLFLWNYTSDVEDGRPPIENIWVIEPFPLKGEAFYNTTSGYLTYVPNLNQFGVDYVYYNACDSENHCSSLRGEVEVTILEVNDPPEAFNFFHIGREDDFDLIAFYDNVTDNETDNLRLAIVDPIDGQYLEEWTTNIGGRLRVYNAHQLFTYSPPPDFVGLDTFTYSVCDTCDPRRDTELGRVDPEPTCLRQLEENGGSIVREDNERVYITCAEAEVEINVANVNDVPKIKDISGLTETGVTIVFTPFENSLVLTASGGNEYFYRNISALVYDADDEQTYLAQQAGLNLTLYNLNQDTDIDEASLILKSFPANGMANVTIIDGRSRIAYTPMFGFSGYDEFSYELCDKQRGEEDESRCSEAFVRVFVTREGPGIVSITADGAKNTQNTNQDFDSKVSKGDTIHVIFAESTNMPPYGNTEQILNTFDVNNLLVFDPPFFIEDIVANPYIGQWLTPTELLLTIVDEGYPQPFRKRTINGERRTTGVMVGEWTLSVAPNNGPCGGFDANGQQITEVDQYCLLSADLTTLHSVATSPVLQGDFGLKLPELANIVIRNVAVDDGVLINNFGDRVFFQESQIALILREPLSYAQRLVYCEQDATEILDPAVLAESVELNVVGCANLLSDGRLASSVYEENIALMLDAFSDGTNRRRRAAESFEDVIRGKRQTFDTLATTNLPVATEVILQAKNLLNPSKDPLRDPEGFVALVQESFKSLTLAQVVSETLGISIDLLIDHTDLAMPIVDNPYVYIERDEELTPQIVRVEVNDPDDLDTVCGEDDTITIFFDVATDQPLVATKNNLDLLLVFSPPIGLDYTGEWISPSVLQITIVETATESFSIDNFNLSFTPNYFHTGDIVTPDNLIVPTETPWCIGINVCGRETTTGDAIRSVGICSENLLSCRANQPWSNLDGDCGTGEPVTPPIFPWWWIAIAVVVVLLIVIVIVVIYFIYRHYTRKAQRKEALRVVRRWKKDQFAPGKEAEKKDVPKPWLKPPGATTMRPNPDPFGSTLQNLPEVVPRPATAITEVENLPPIPPQQPFKPRGPAHIRPSLPSLQSATSALPPRRLTSVTSLPPQLGLPQLAAPPGVAPSRVDQTRVLRPLVGGTIAQAARVALREEGITPTVGTAMPGAVLPRRLAPIDSTGTQDRGKGPSDGRTVPKKGSPYTSSEEDVTGGEGGIAVTSPKPSLAPISPLSPPFQPTRPLPPIGGSRISRTSGQLPRLSLPTSPTAGMPTRSVPPDPFASLTSPAGPISPKRSTPLSPLRPSISREPPTPVVTGTAPRVARPSATLASPSSPKEEPETVGGQEPTET